MQVWPKQTVLLLPSASVSSSRALSVIVSWGAIKANHLYLGSKASLVVIMPPFLVIINLFYYLNLFCLIYQSSIYSSLKPIELS